MDDIIYSTKKLIEAFDSSDMIKNLRYYKKLVLDNDKLIYLINKYNNTTSNYEKLSLKKEINSYYEYREYMKYYNELFYYVMDINKRFKIYTDVRGCHNESN